MADAAAAAAAAVALLGVEAVLAATAAADGAAGAVAVAMFVAEVLDPGPAGDTLDVLRRLAQDPPGLEPEEAWGATLVGEGDG